MRLREKPEISGEMGMSSMTDIIFILLIFFMMISTMVHPSALALSLPGNSKTTKKPINTDRIDDLAITASGNFLLNGVTSDIPKIKGFLERNKVKKPDYKVMVSPDSKAPVEKVVQILDITQTMGVSSILHTEVAN
jgi:biopolymer transport protein ExbD